MPGVANTPSIDEMLMIEPPPAAFIGSMTARIPRNVPSSFTSKHAAVLGHGRVGDAAQHEHGRVVDEHVHRAGRLDEPRPVFFVRDVAVHVARAGPDRFGGGVAALVEHVGDHDRRSLGHEPLGDLGARTARTTGDDRGLPGQSPAHRGEPNGVAGRGFPHSPRPSAHS